MRFSLTPERDSDADFLFRLYAETRESEMSMVPWTTDQKEIFLKQQFDVQRGYYRTKYPAATFSILRVGDEPVGRLYVAETPAVVNILDITILGRYRGMGLGSEVLAPIIARAKDEGRSVAIYLNVGDRSASLFTRLGFSIAKSDGIYELWVLGDSAALEETAATA